MKTNNTINSRGPHNPTPITHLLHESLEVSADRLASVLLVGDFSQERVDLTYICEQFGWKVETITSINDIHTLPAPASIVTSLVDLSLEGPAALERVSEQLPGCLLIACCSFRQRYDWAELEAAGAYQMLYKPLRAKEVLHSFWFVQSHLDARRRRVIEIGREPGYRQMGLPVKANVG